MFTTPAVVPRFRVVTCCGSPDNAAPSATVIAPEPKSLGTSSRPPLTVTFPVNPERLPVRAVVPAPCFTRFAAVPALDKFAETVCAVAVLRFTAPPPVRLKVPVPRTFWLSVNPLSAPFVSSVVVVPPTVSITAFNGTVIAAPVPVPVPVLSTRTAPPPKLTAALAFR